MSWGLFVLLLKWEASASDTSVRLDQYTIGFHRCAISPLAAEYKYLLTKISNTPNP